MGDYTNLKGMSALEYILAEEVAKPFIKYQELTKWDNPTLDEYKELLTKLKNCTTKEASNTKEAGDALENVVTFIIKHSVFLHVANNIRSATNEIDQVITFSSEGKLLLTNDIKLTELLGFGSKETIIIGECKNYSSKVGVTYIGKLYSVMVAHDISIGLLFTREGITGKENSFEDAFGLIKVIRIYEKYKNSRELYIIPFTLKDLENITSVYDFFEMIKRKKDSLKLSILEKSLVDKEPHINIEPLGEALSNLRQS